MTSICLALYTRWDRMFLPSTRVLAAGCIIFVLGVAVPGSAARFGAGAFSSNEALRKMYASLSPASQRPCFRLFKMGMQGYAKLLQGERIENSQYLTLIDYTLSSNKRRLWVIDLEKQRIRHHSLVAHGRNSGDEFAARFSNVPESHMSSLGFFITGRTYHGKHGISLILDGMEPGINDNARRRAIVIHSAQYATRHFADMHGRLGRSYGCPTLPPEKGEKIMELIKNRSCMFIYFPDQAYLTKTHMLPQSSQCRLSSGP